MAELKNSVFLNRPFWNFFFQKTILFCFIPMKISQKLCDRMDGVQLIENFFWACCSGVSLGMLTTKVDMIEKKIFLIASANCAYKTITQTFNLSKTVEFLRHIYSKTFFPNLSLPKKVTCFRYLLRICSPKTSVNINLQFLLFVNFPEKCQHRNS